MELKMTIGELEEFLAREFPQVSDEYAIEALSPGSISVRLKVQERHLRPGATVSGPSLFALADVSVYLATLSLIGPEALTVTTSCNIDFMRKPVKGADILAEARILKKGRVLVVADVMMFSEGAAEPAARASMTYSIPPARKAG